MGLVSVVFYGNNCQSDEGLVYYKDNRIRHFLFRGHWVYSLSMSCPHGHTWPTQWMLPRVTGMCIFRDCSVISYHFRWFEPLRIQHVYLQIVTLSFRGTNSISPSPLPPPPISKMLIDMIKNHLSHFHSFSQIPCDALLALLYPSGLPQEIATPAEPYPN